MMLEIGSIVGLAFMGGMLGAIPIFLILTMPRRGPDEE